MTRLTSSSILHHQIRKSRHVSEFKRTFKRLRSCPLDECNLLQLIVGEEMMDLMIDEGDFDGQQDLSEVLMVQRSH
jgi:hypothetical protein